MPLAVCLSVCLPCGANPDMPHMCVHILQVERKIEEWIEEKVVKHSDTKYVFGPHCSQQQHLSVLLVILILAPIARIQICDSNSFATVSGAAEVLALQPLLAK